MGVSIAICELAPCVGMQDAKTSILKVNLKEVAGRVLCGVRPAGAGRSGQDRLWSGF